MESERDKQVERFWRNFSPFVFLALFYAAVFGWTGYSVGVRVEKPEEAGRRAEHTATEYDDCAAREWPAVGECVAKAVETSRSAQLDERDLAAQEQMARWTLWLFALGAGTLPLTALGVYLVLENLRAAQKSTNAAQDQVRIAKQTFELERRPWIKLTLEEGGLASSDGTRKHVEVPLKLTIKNYGRTPALYVTYYYNFAGLNSQALLRQDVDEDIAGLIEREIIARSNPKARPHWFTIFPDEEIDVTATALGANKHKSFEASRTPTDPKLTLMGNRAVAVLYGAVTEQNESRPLIFETTRCLSWVILLPWSTWTAGEAWERKVNRLTTFPLYDTTT